MQDRNPPEEPDEGNGTASRETESLAAEVISEAKAKDAKSKAQLAYVMVNEAGASVYSASDLARAEFPDLDGSMRAAWSTHQGEGAMATTPESLRRLFRGGAMSGERSPCSC